MYGDGILYTAYAKRDWRFLKSDNQQMVTSIENLICGDYCMKARIHNMLTYLKI